MGNRYRAACLEGQRIRWIVGWSPGGGFDTYSRLAEPFIERTLGAQIAIDNVPGAGGLVGARAISRARPDGRTLGILNGSGFLWNRNPDAGQSADLSRDFTVLARVSRRQQVVIAGPASGARSLEELVALSRSRPVVAGITAPDSSNFASVAAVTDLLGIRTEYLAGYPGSREALLGLQRGDTDFSSFDIETFLQVSDLDDLTPLLQITPERSPDPRMTNVPHLAGPTGLITRQPELFSGNRDRARSLSAAIVAYLELGRLFAGPPAMNASLRDCMEQAIAAALTDPGFTAAAQRANRSVDFLPGADVRRDIPAFRDAVRPIAPVAAAAVRRIR
jgi:tripartite-type tricarboxylate transporter receptor subunit TctC